MERSKARRDEAREAILEISERAAALARSLANQQQKVRELKKKAKKLGAAASSSSAGGLAGRTVDEFVFDMARRQYEPVRLLMETLRAVAVDCKVFEDMHNKLGIPVVCESI